MFLGRQVDRLWILDVDGRRVVVDITEGPAVTATQREELQQVVGGLDLEGP
jgi:hypothetical protein